MVRDEPSGAPEWHLYIVRCADGSLYTGIATDVTRRLTEHRDGSGRGAKYLRGRGPISLVAECSIGSRQRALAVERRIKALAKARKEALVRDRSLLNALVDNVARPPH